MMWVILFGFTEDYLSVVDQAVLTEPGLVRTTVNPLRAARWPSRDAVAAWLGSVGLAAGPVPTVGIGTGELTPVPWTEPIPGLHALGVQFEMRVGPKPAAAVPSAELAIAAARRKRVRDESMPLFDESVFGPVRRDRRVVGATGQARAGDRETGSKDRTELARGEVTGIRAANTGASVGPVPLQRPLAYPDRSTTGTANGERPAPIERRGAWEEHDG